VPLAAVEWLRTGQNHRIGGRIDAAITASIGGKGFMPHFILLRTML